MFVTVLVASTLGKIFQPFFDAMAWVIAAFYAVIPNYAIAIALLTVAVMAVTAPLTIKSTRSMMAMSRLQPQMKELQKKFAKDKARLNEEMMKLYRENDVNPAAGCVPLIIQFPVFIILYDVIRGLTNTVKVGRRIVSEPRYIGHATALYKSLVDHPGHMNAFGVNLADTVFSHITWPARIPYLVMILIAIGLQYFQMRQMNKRNTANQLNQQMQAMQRYMPLIFAVIYIRISAGVNVYFIISSLCRIGLQLWSFRSMPAPGEAARVGRIGGPAAKPRRKTLMERLAEAQQRALAQQQGHQEQEQQAQRRPAGPEPLAGGGPRRTRGPGGDGVGTNGSGTTAGGTTASRATGPKGGGPPKGAGPAKGSGPGGARPAGQRVGGATGARKPPRGPQSGRPGGTGGDRGPAASSAPEGGGPVTNGDGPSSNGGATAPDSDKKRRKAN